MTSEKPIFKGSTVLVVDDQEAFRDAVAFEFEILGMHPIKAENGLDALEKIKQNKVDIIFSDIRMPVCDGGNFLDQLRKTQPNTPPFVFMTGFADLKPFEAFDRGADDFIGKPLKNDIIPDLLEKLLCPEAQKWSTAPAKEPMIAFSLDFKGTPSSKDFQMGRSGFFVSYESTPALIEVPKDALVRFRVHAPSAELKDISGIGKIVWSRVNPDSALFAGCGIQIEYLDDLCRASALEFIKKQKRVYTVPKGSRDHA